MTTTAMSLHRRLMREEEPEWIVWALVIVMLALALFLRNSVTGHTQNFNEGGVSLNYPAAWTQMAEPDQLLHAVDPFSSAQFPTGVTVRQVPLAEVSRNLSSLSDIALAWSTRQGRDLLAYRTLNVAQTTVNGQEAVLVESAYVPQVAMGSSTGSVPVVARAQNFLFQQGDTLTIITLAADANVFEAENNVWQDILATVNVGG